MLLLLIVLLADLLFNRLYLSFFHYPLDALGAYTNGRLEPLASLSILKLMFITVGIVVWIGRFRTRDLGLWVKNIPSGILAAVFLWAFLQLAMLIAGLLSTGFIRFADGWEGMTPLYTTAGIVVFALTKALFDEITYRGLLLPQLHTKLQRFVPFSSGVNLILAVLISQLIYVIIQVPLIDFGEGNGFHLASGVFSVFALSILNALVFLRTRNLYIGAAIHALWYRTVLFADTDFPPLIALGLLVVALIAIWPLLPDRRTVLYAQPLEDQSLY